MKMKKLLALALAAVMAVSMLTACGGGGNAVSIDRGEVEEILAEAGYEADVSTSLVATVAAKQMAAAIKDENYATIATALAGGVLVDNLPQDMMGACQLVAQENLAANSVTAESFAAGTIRKLSEAGYGPKFAIAVADATTADGVPCYLFIAVAL